MARPGPQSVCTMLSLTFSLLILWFASRSQNGIRNENDESKLWYLTQSASEFIKVSILRALRQRAQETSITFTSIYCVVEIALTQVHTNQTSVRIMKEDIFQTSSLLVFPE